MKLIVDLLFGVIFTISLAGLGVVVSRSLFEYKSDFVTGFFIGCGVSAVLAFIAGMLGLYSDIFNAAFIIIVFLFAIAGRRSLIKYRLPIDRRYLLPLLLLGLVFVMAGLTSLSPPIKNDTLYYHMGLPKLWAADGGITFYPWLSFSTTALNSEALLTPIVDFVSPEAAQFWVFLVGVMVILLLAGAVRKFANSSPALAILVLGSVSFFCVGLVDAKNDYLAAGFAFMAFVFYAEYFKDNSLKLIILSGIFAGLAASTKANSLIFAFAILMTLSISRHRLKHVLIFCAMAFIFGSPWYIKSFIQTGNPLYPFFHEYFNSPVWHDLFTGFNNSTNVANDNRSILNFMTSPFRLVYWPDIFRTRIGPLPMILLPLLALIRGVPPMVKKALIISAIFYPFWYIAWPVGRYLMPIIVLLSFVGAFILGEITARSRYISLIVILGFCGLIILNGVQIYRDGSLRIKTAFGIVDKDTFLHTAASLNPNQLQSAGKVTALPYIDIWNYMNATAGKDETIGILCSNWNRADGFYLDIDHMYLNPSGQTVIDFTKDKYSIASDIVENEIRYVLIDKNVIEEFSPDSEFEGAPGFDILARGVADFIDITKQNGRLIYITDRFEMYRMKNLSSILKAPFS